MPITAPKKITPRFPTFYKAFGKSDLDPQTGEILISNYILPGLFPTLSIALRKTKLNLDEIYVVCPQYTDKRTGDFSDFQMTITGTPFCSEHPDETAKREFQEETGLIASLYNRTVQRLEGNKRPVQNYWCEIDNHTQLFQAQNQIIHSERDDKSRKIQILAFGKLSDLEILLQKNNELCPLYSRDTDPNQNTHSYITGIRLISMIDFIEIVGFVA